MAEAGCSVGTSLPNSESSVPLRLCLDVVFTCARFRARSRLPFSTRTGLGGGIKDSAGTAMVTDFVPVPSRRNEDVGFVCVLGDFDKVLPDAEDDEEDECPLFNRPSGLRWVGLVGVEALVCDDLP